MSTPQTPGAHLDHVTESDVASLNSSTVTSIPPVRLKLRSKLTFQEQLLLTLLQISGSSWARYTSFLLAHIILRSISLTGHGPDTSVDAPALTVARIAVIVHALIPSLILVAHAYPTGKIAKSLVKVIRLTDRWTPPSFRTPLVCGWMGDVGAVAVVVACAYIGSTVYRPEDAVSMTQAVLLGAVGRAIFTVMRKWIFKLTLWLDQAAAALRRDGIGKRA